MAILGIPGNKPAPPDTSPSGPTTTLPNDAKLVERVDVTGAQQEVDEYTLASGWSY